MGSHLPGTDALGQPPRVVEEGDPQLDELQQVHVALHQLVAVVVRVPAVRWVDHNTFTPQGVSN